MAATASSQGSWRQHLDGEGLSALSVGTAGTASGTAALETLMRRQDEWEERIEKADAQSPDLNAFQWKVVRQQVSTLARELGVVQRRLAGSARHETRLAEAERRLGACEAAAEEGRRFTAAAQAGTEQRQAASITADEALARELAEQREFAEAEARRREAADADVAARLAAVDRQLREHVVFADGLGQSVTVAEEAAERASCEAQAAAREAQECCRNCEALGQSLRHVAAQSSASLTDGRRVWEAALAAMRVEVVGSQRELVASWEQALREQRRATDRQLEMSLSKLQDMIMESVALRLRSVSPQVVHAQDDGYPGLRMVMNDGQGGSAGVSAGELTAGPHSLGGRG